jgi:hypothetical protein
MTSKGTLRRHERNEQSAVVQIMWKDRNGADKYANARTLDISESGMRIEVPEPLQERSYVTLRADKLKLNGTASVRTCIRKGTRYWVGLEFSVGMKWKPPEPDAAPVPQET